MRRRAFLAWLLFLALWPRRAVGQPRGTWRRIETDLDPDTTKRGPVEDTIEVSKDAAKGKLKKKSTSIVSVHFCPHAAGEPASEWYHCKDDPRAQYEEM